MPSLARALFQVSGNTIPCIMHLIYEVERSLKSLKVYRKLIQKTINKFKNAESIAIKKKTDQKIFVRAKQRN